MEKAHLIKVVEALIFASDTPLSINQMSAILEDVNKKDIESAVDELTLTFNNNAFFIKKVSFSIAHAGGNFCLIIILTFFSRVY